MGHDHHHHHAHGHTHGDRRRLALATGLTAGFMLVEAVGGVLAGSLALLADAAHMLTDAGSLALALVAFRVTDRGADRRRTFGYHRFPVLAAFVNGLTLAALVVWIAVEAVRRLLTPTPVMGEAMLAVAAVGLAVNLAVFLILHGGSRDNLNVRGALLHVLGDLLGSVAALVAAGVILTTGWTPIDPLLSLLVAALVGRSAWYLLREAGHVLLEGAPDHLDPDAIAHDLPGTVPGVCGVHHVHAWALSPDRPMMSLHITADASAAHDDLTARVKHRLHHRHGVAHATVQVEYGACCPDEG